jgi:cytochrome c oxidase subunit 2
MPVNWHRWLPIASATVLAVLAAPAAAGWSLFADPATPIAARVGSLFNLILLITGVIFVGVWAVLGVAIWRFRHRPGQEPRLVHGNVLVEVIWTVVPAILLLVIAVPAYSTLMAEEQFPPIDMTVEVIGHQWYWEYRYPASGLRLVNQPLRLPARRNVKLILTSADVIHNWYVPDFAFKLSTIPGRVNQMWLRVERPGTYAGQCAELCGTLHSRMGIAVEAMPPERFASWQTATLASSQTATLAQATAPGGGGGRELYETNCASCHQPGGGGLAGAIPPLGGAEIPNGPADEHIRTVLHGRQGPLTVKGHLYNGVMPPFVQLTDGEIAAIISYERTSWGNHGGPVSADQVRNLRGR